MIGDKSFDDLNVRLQEIKENHVESFGGVSLLFIGDFFQLVPVGQDSIYEPKPFNFAWEEFKLYELDKNVRQSGGSEFVHYLTDLEKVIIP